jgi:ferrous iron transport protein A
MGLAPGGEVTMVQNFGRGPVIVLARSTRIALGRGEAMKVHVRKLAERT